MGCTTGNLACQPSPQPPGSPAPEQDNQALSQLEAQGPKVPEVLSSLERLSQATGGMEKSWYRCIFPFGIISLVIGVSGTAVTCTYNDLPLTKVVTVVLLIAGLVLTLTATACWTLHKRKKRKKKERAAGAGGGGAGGGGAGGGGAGGGGAGGGGAGGGGAGGGGSSFTSEQCPL